MAKYSGRDFKVGVAKEGARGTLHGVAEYWPTHLSFTPIERVEKVRDISGQGVLETPSGADIVKRYTEGDLEMNVSHKSIGLFLLALFGAESASTDDPESDVCTHTYTVSTSNQHQSLTVYLEGSVREVAAGNVMINSMTFEGALDQYVKATVNLMGGVYESYTQTAAYVAETLFRPHDLSIKFATNVAGLAAATAETTVRRFSFTVNKNVEDFQGLGDYDPVDFINKNFEVSGEFEILFEDTTELDYVLNNTKKAVRFAMTNTEDVVGVETNPSLTFDFSEVDFHDPEVDRSLENIVVLTVSFTAHYKLSETDMLEATLINDVNAAY